MKKQLVLAMAAVLACAGLVPAQDAPSGSKATKGGGFYNYGMLLGVPPFIEDVETLSRDAKELFRDGIIDSVALSCPIVPRGDPPTNKADAFAEMYRALRKRLEGSGIPTGILLYATMGHGGSSTMPSPFQKIILGRNGKVSAFFCPEDEKFCEYIAQNIRKLGQEMPDFFIVDDDARLLTLRQGCFCPLHVDRFNRLHSTTYSPEELRKLVFTDTAFAHQYDELLRQTMENYFRGVRKAIDDISPDIHCGLFACVQEARYSGRFAEILAGKTGHPMVRINNGRYLSDKQRDVPAWLRKTAGQMVLYGNRFHILSETDTAPHNRYSMSAYSLLQHIVLSYLEGCKGGSLWITSVQNSDVFASGQAYRDVLRKYKGQLQALRKMDVAWAGPGVPVSTEGVFDFPNKESTVNSWEFIFGRMGIPFTFTSDGASCNALTARQIQELSAKQLETIFRTSAVLVDGDAALALTEQGHADWLGCQVDKEMPPVSLEIWNGRKIRGSGTDCRHLSPLPKENAFQPKVFEQLSAFATPTLQPDQPPQTIAPAALHTVNCFGQHVITMARSTNFGDTGFACAVLMNEIRKAQLIDFLNKLNPLGLYYTEDAELLLRYGFQGKQRIAYVANLGFDPLDTIPLRGEWTKSFTEVQMLDLDGQWKKVPATKTSDGTLQLQLPLAAHRVVISRFL